MLNKDGTLGGETVPIEPCGIPVQLTDGAVPAIPIFADEMTGERRGNASQFAFTVGADASALEIRKMPGSPMLDVEFPPGLKLLRSTGLQAPTEIRNPDGVHQFDPAGSPQAFFQGSFDSYFDIFYP